MNSGGDEMRVTSLVAAIVLLVGSAAQAEWIPFDVEANNTPATANPLISDIAIVNARFAACSPASDIGLGSLAAGGADVNWYKIDLPGGCIVTAITTPYEEAPGTLAVPDTTLGAFGPGGFIVSDDDAGSDLGGINPGNARGSAIRFITTVPGTYFFAVSGFNDGVSGIDPVLFDGLASDGFPHGEVGRYALTISVFPEPSTLVLLGLGGLALIRRRK